jgi:hypothetical protein
MKKGLVLLFAVTQLFWILPLAIVCARRQNNRLRLGGHAPMKETL